MSEKQETFLQSFIEAWRETDKREILLLFIIGSEIGWIPIGLERKSPASEFGSRAARSTCTHLRKLWRLG